MIGSRRIFCLDFLRLGSFDLNLDFLRSEFLGQCGGQLQDSIAIGRLHVFGLTPSGNELEYW